MYTDGACSGNPGPGGWGTVLMFGEHKKEISGFMPDTTNNRMELFAAVQGFTALKQPCAVTLYSDSAYLVNAFKQNWIDGWQRNGWKTSGKKEVESGMVFRRKGVPMGAPGLDEWHIPVTDRDEIRQAKEALYR